ncbi:2,3-bisphosphoglycerate-independent phosphoglycerate mutase [Marinobacterium nitratireducens]|uniref:2,3-bisphosphoglycerate-independent phosphoglycerate mutase n=1 Tax=Marinobacterium nitratireducens TaxID=518897 RepID=A0A918DYE5_9GAMM|nr:2,3-bisphosphoglycerate-independent phosphoglycerate mutase [Marinobacterium nitratireducens]GGO87985.1 2,3-bisphosphoglycerate-independent phosphoglycerate mutase [Marinobacterium nitratireducens]
MTEPRVPRALLILDGFGVEHSESSAIEAASTPTWDRLLAENPNARIQTSGMAVGLPDGQMGNSEVGHMNIGAGRVVYQNFTRISKAIADGDFFENPVLTAAIDKAVAQGGAVHVLGLLSPGGVHSHEDHLLALLEMAAARGAGAVHLHGILDGRDMPPRSAEPSIEKAEAKLAEIGVGSLATLVGRYFAMDRDNRWDRVKAAYDAMVHGKAPQQAKSGKEALESAYGRGENDEFVQATVLTDDRGQPRGQVKDGDVVICANFRPDRAREITRAFVDADFDGFDRGARPQLADYVMLTEYAADIEASCAYPPQAISNDLGEYLSGLGKTQLRIAETEKYAHVTFFFNGGQEAVYPGEERILVPSPDVATYDLKPEMSAPEVTEKLCAAIRSGQFDLIVCNFANGDMVGHTGKFDAAVKACEVVDESVRQVLEAMREVGGETLITADHGNVELMVNPKTGQPHTSHTNWPVALIYDGPRADRIRLADGALCDLAPTLLSLMAIEQPPEMTGKPLVTLS